MGKELSRIYATRLVTNSLILLSCGTFHSKESVLIFGNRRSNKARAAIARIRLAAYPRIRQDEKIKFAIISTIRSGRP
jgi:hypothetical protein